jgi:type IV/VI secretion system ImpK/VasF family protein
MTEALSRLIYPLIQCVIDLQARADRGDHPPFQAQREEILAMIRDAANHAQADALLVREFPLIRRFLAYWIDEVLINSKWKYAKDWETSTLEWDFYQEALHAEKYFEAAEEAIGLEGTDPLETCILGLALGFRGTYRPDLTAFPREAERYLKYYRKRVRDTPPPEKGNESQPLVPLPGPLILLGTSILVSATSIVTLVCFLLNHSPSRF